MRISDQKIDEIRAAIDIVDVIGGSVKLKKRGKNFLGLCPFHQEKTPSFTVSQEKQMFHCFGCHKGGNVFTFVMELEKLTFVEAVRMLAQRVGISLPDEEGPSADQSETEALYNACAFAGNFFFSNLAKTDEGRSALEYFKKRGFSEETVRTFGLGYSMDAWDALLVRAKSEGLPPENLLKAGLLRQREDGSFYDYFRGRAMFPILSTTGRVIGFGARKLRDDDPIQGKYINSPETPIYNKSRILFGLSHSKEAIRQDDAALMVEGYADLISLFQAGVQNVVASSGTALTEEQLIVLGRYTKRLFLVYDADTAGSSATVRGIDLALEKDFDVQIVELPEGEDPDSFVQKHGAKDFRKLIEQSVSFIDFKAKQFLKSGAMATPEGKTQAVRSVVQSIAKMKDELKRNFYVKEVAEKYAIYESMLFRELERWVTQERRFAQRPSAAADQPIATATPEATSAAVGSETIPPAERDIIKLMLEGNVDLVQFIFSHISVDHISHPSTRTLVEMLLNELDVHGAIDATAFLHHVEDAKLKSLLTDLMVSKYELSRKWAENEKEIDEPEPIEIARAAVRALHRQEIVRAMEENQQAIKSAADHGEDAMPLLRRQQELLQVKKDVEQPDYLKQ